MKIYCNNNQNHPQANQIVKRVGKYLYKHLESSYKIENTVNTTDVYISVYYQRKKKDQDWTKPNSFNDMHEMKIDISITTYSNKIRINVIEMNPEEKTIGFNVYKPEFFDNMGEAYKHIINNIKNHIEAEFIDYEFVF